MVQLGLRALAILVLAAPAPAMAQMDWLTPSLESQRHDNLRRHQQRLHEQRLHEQRLKQREGEARGKTPMEGDSQITFAQRQAAWSRHKSEYRQRLLREGQPSADRWLDQQILAGR